MKNRLAQHETQGNLVVSTYDRVSAGLISSILSFGFVAFLLLLALLANVRAEPKASLPVVTPPLPITSVTSDDSSVIPELDVENEFPVPDSKLSLDLISDAVSTAKMSFGTNPDGLLDGGVRLKDPRDPGPVPTIDQEPEASRWLISYETTDIEEYARQLDFFGIEIGVVRSGSNEIIRVSRLQNTPLTSYSDRQQETQTLRFSHRKQAMKRWDQAICREAGVDTTNSLLCQFYPESTREIIRQVEAETLARKGRKLSDIGQTILKVQLSGNGFEFVVLDFNYRL